ncbi:DMT family transporter [Altererythrobacter sp. KTW20L]|uniref:DMT family transporter n=1 Tax=Altererythrobacter sp. KTW20L TaxID=2942210 RepID=UPI0020C11E96|nr:DMT family transporter [Altererythrobacter sp. KTW20L]MCL6249536.1 DMT family transporter [Altererythrobacter sp. KTW20L]
MSASEHDRPMLALLVRLGGILGLSIMAALIKLASERGIHLAEIIFWRQFTTLPIILAFAALTTGGVRQLATKRPGAHAMRGIYGAIGMVFNFGAVILLPLAEATTINFSAPIWAVILSIVLLKEKVGWWRCSAVLAGFAGILVITQPGGSHIPLQGALVAMGGAFMIALISIQIRDLSSTEKPMAIVFWFAVLSSLCALPFMPFVTKAHTGEEWLILLGIGLAGTWGQLMITAALRYGKVSSVIVMDYSAIVWATLLGFLLFAVLPPASTFVGAPLIIAAGIIIAWRERVVSKRRFADLRDSTSI